MAKEKRALISKGEISSPNPKDYDITFDTWDEIFEFQARTDGANYSILKDWLKKYYQPPTLK